jgi:subtilisin family serine protease
MSYRFANKSYTRTAVIGVLTVSLLGCMQATARHSAATPRSMSRAGAVLNAVGNRALGLFETQTISLALDRIDQRDLPLDNTYRRSGSGKGVVVYVFDGGILSNHPEVRGRVRKGYDAFPSDPEVCNAHGTAVAGAIGGRTLGVATDVELVDVKMVECGKLRGTIRAIVEGTKWVLEDAQRHGRPAVANWSFIADTSSHIAALDSAIAELRAANIPVVVSAGNLDINACRVSPGNAEGAIVVGSSAVVKDASKTRVIDERAPNTAFGPCVDIYAPGDSVLLPSIDMSGAPSAQLWNGTSMSAGYVSGAIALYLQSNPAARPDDALNALRASATMNVVQNTRAPLSWLLYVGAPETHVRVAASPIPPSVDELRRAGRP